jgi:hypothetical protein
VSKWAVLQEPIGKDQIGEAVIEGITVAKVYVKNERHRFCEIKHDETTYLASGQSGADILWKESGYAGVKWAIIRIGTSTPIIRFELTAALTPGGYAAARLLDYNGSYVADATVTFNVYDVLSTQRGRAPITSPAAAGSTGYALYCFDSQRFEILVMQPMTLMLSAQVNQTSVAKTDSTFVVDTCAIMQPIGGLLAPMPTTAYNPFGLALADNDPVILLWNEGTTHWNAIAPGGDGTGKVSWALWQSGSNGTGASVQTFSVKACKYDGTANTGNAFNVKTPIKKCADTALFSGYVVGYQTEADGTKVIVTDCWDDPMGTVKQWDVAIANIRDGWTELPNSAGRYIVGVDNDHALDATGGSLTHTHTHDKEGEVGTFLLSCFWPTVLNDHEDTNHEPPWLGLYNIKRTS